MQTDIAIKVSLGTMGDDFEPIDDCLQVDHFKVSDPNIFLAKLTRENGTRPITTSLGSGVGTFLVAARDSELRLEQQGRLLYHGIMVEDSVTYIEGSEPISVELQSDACLYVLTYLYERFQGPCPVIGGRFNIRDLRLAELLSEITDGSAARRGDITRDFSRRAFERYQSLPRVHPLSAWRLNRVRRHAESRLDQRMTLEELADVAGFSRAHFAATFKAATSISVHEFLLRLRIQTAAKLLLSTDLSLVDISLQTGFQNQAHFTTVFKKMTSATPGRWRESRRRTDMRTISGVAFKLPGAIEQAGPDAQALDQPNLH